MDENYIDDGYTEGDFYINSDIYINWGTREIYVPRRVGTLIQTIPTEVRTLDITFFWSQLEDLEDSETGIAYPDTNTNSPPVAIGGVTLARVLEIINGYTITFEDGLYTVQIIGGNSNIGDVVNRNQVSIATANSAGLVDNSSLADISLDTTQILQLSEFIRKLLANRASISPDNAVTTIYDDDQTTPVHVFDHADERNRVPR